MYVHVLQSCINCVNTIFNRTYGSCLSDSIGGGGGGGVIKYFPHL